MNNPAVLALDVDGVLNAGGRSGREIVRVAMRPEWVTALTDPEVIGRELELRIDRERDSRFLAAVEELGVEIVWCTTWEVAANEAIGPLYGLGPRDVLAVSSFYTGMRTPSQAKAAAIDHHFPDRHVLWLDDMACSCKHLWAGREDRAIVAPAAQWGLRTEERERVIRWCLDGSGQRSRRAREVLRDAGVPDRAARPVQVLGAG